VFRAAISPGPFNPFLLGPARHALKWKPAPGQPGFPNRRYYSCADTAGGLL